LAEWSGIGLQNRARRFESATDLLEHVKAPENQGLLIFLVANLVTNMN
jgi:hypothetical protein